MFVISAVLVSSFAVSVLPYANALTQRTDFSNRHTTASWGNSRVCGDHICKSGEQTQLQMKLSSAQRGETGNTKVHTQMPVINAPQSGGMTGMPNNK